MYECQEMSCYLNIPNRNFYKFFNVLYNEMEKMEGVPQQQRLNTTPPPPPHTHTHTQEDTSRLLDFFESATICLPRGK